MRIIEIWVFGIVGDPIGDEHGTPYVQEITSEYSHNRPDQRDAVERSAMKEYTELYPGHPICECGWHRQAVEVAG